MSRPIKFRVWDGKKMTYPHHWSSGRFLHLKVSGWELRAIYEEDDWIFDGEDEVYTPFYVDRVLASEEKGHVLMQFTGLTDADGKEIYEGDVVERDDGLRQVVEWSEEAEGYAGQSVTGFCMDTNNDGDGRQNAHVIGNIYENPELIDG